MCCPIGDRSPLIVRGYANYNDHHLHLGLFVNQHVIISFGKPRCLRIRYRRSKQIESSGDKSPLLSILLTFLGREIFEKQ